MYPQSNVTENEADVALALLSGEGIRRCGNPEKKCNHWARLPGSNSQKSPYWCLCCNDFTKRPDMEHQYLCDGTRV